MKLNKVFVACALAVIPYSAQSQSLIATGFGPAVTQPLAEDVARITAATGTTTTTIMQATQNVIAAVHSSGTEASKATLSAASKTSTDNLTSAQIQMKLEMDYKAQIEAQRQKDRAKLISDETDASVKFIESFLRREDIKHLNISEVIDYTKTQLDSKAVVVEPPALAPSCNEGDKACLEKKEKMKNVGFERKFTPSSHLETYAEMCAVGKKQKAIKSAETSAKNRTNIDSARKSQETLNKTNSREAQSARIKEQQNNTCTPDAVDKGLCGTLTKGDYIEKVLKNEIIPNGGQSAANLYAPSAVGGAGIVNLESPELKKMAQMVEFDSLEKTAGGKKDLPKIVQTYRNSAQLKAAESFVENIVNLDAIGNQPVSERKKESSVAFQSMFMSRAAQLDLAKNTLNQSVAERRGQKLSGIPMSSIKSGTLIKEVEDGAGPLDLKWHQIQEDMDKVSPANIDKLTAMSDNQIWLEMYTTLVKKNEAQFDRRMRLERQSLLLASLLAAQANDPKNIEYMKRVGE